MVENTGLATTAETGLVPTNPQVVRLAKRLRWSPDRAILRIQRALPAPLEQQIYLALASDFGILPESMNKLLRFYLGENNLQLEDLEPRPVGPNMVTSKFANFAEFLRECLNLLKLVTREYNELSLTVDYAARIVQHYGTFEPERLIEMIDSGLDEMCDVLGIGFDHPYHEKMRLCIWVVVTKVLPENMKDGRPDIVDITDLLSVFQDRKREFRRLSSEFVEEIRDMSPVDVSRTLKNYGVR